jgi:hypothetical protein
MDREKLSYNEFFNLNDLRKHFSVEDLAILYWINNESGIFQNSTGMMEQNVWNTPLEWEYINNQLKPMKPIAMDAIKARLGTMDTSAIPVDVSDDYVPFKIVNIADKMSVFVVIQYPGQTNEHRELLITELLKLLYAHTGYDNMANNELFKGYIERLALVNNAL